MSRFLEKELSMEPQTGLALIFSYTSDGIIMVADNGVIVGANAAFQNLSGWTAGELVGKLHICEICQGMATCRADLTCAECFFKQDVLPSFEMKIRLKRGGDLSVSASSTRLSEGSQAAFVLILRDMTEQHRAEQERNQEKLTRYVIQAQEEERKRISRELHDGVGQALYSILVGLKVVSQQEMDEQVKHHLDDVQMQTTRAMEEVKRLAVELRPSALDDLGLLPAIRSFIKRYENTFGIEVTLRTNGNRRRYPAAVETTLYRILQEAMTNTAKYADANMILVLFEDNGDRLWLTVTDDGKGFNPEMAERSANGLGLFGMKERAHLLGGALDIHSSAGKGTSVIVSLPLGREGSLHANSHPHLG